MHITLHDVIRDTECHAVLSRMAALHGGLERKLYAAFAASRYDNAAFKRGFCSTYALTSRQFNSMAVEVKGKIDGVRESLVSHRDDAVTKLRSTRRTIADLVKMVETGRTAKGRKLSADKLARKRLSLHEKKRKAGRIADAIAALDKRIKAAVPGICFGTRKLFQSQFAKPETPARPSTSAIDELVAHNAWQKTFWAVRNSQFLLVGSSDETAGCSACQATVEADGTLTMRLRPFNAMLPERAASGKPLSEMKRRKTPTARPEDFVTIRGLTFPHGMEHLKAALAQRLPLSWRFLKADNGRWHVHVSFDVAEDAVFDTKGGAVGVDFNVDHIAVTVVDRHGNFVTCRRFPLSVYGVPSGLATDRIRCAARDVVAWAKHLGLPLVAEDLDFHNKKRSLSAVSAKRARMLSSLHYSAWGQALRSRCQKDGVALRLVNPAFTSLIGRVKFATSLGLSVHHAAALVIARRGMALSERLPRSPVGVPDGRGFHVTLDPVVNMGCRHVWKSWTKQAKAVKAALAAPSSADAKAKRLRLASTATGHTLERWLDDVIPDFGAGSDGVADLGVRGAIPRRRPDHPVAGCLSLAGSSTAPDMVNHT